MLSLFLSIILLFFAYRSYSKEGYGEMLFYLSVIACDFFGFGKILGQHVIKNEDLVIASSSLLCIISYYRSNKFFTTQNDTIGKIILIIYIYICINFIFTIIFDQDSFSNAFKVIRVYLILPLYFVLKKMSVKQFERYINFMLYASILQGVFYYLQFVGLTGVLSGYGSDAEYISINETRMGNYPSTAMFFFLYYLFDEKSEFQVKLPKLIFWGMMPILGQMRGEILTIGLASAIFFLSKRNLKYSLYVVFAYFAYTFVVSPMLEIRDKNSKMTTKDEIQLVVKHPLDLYKHYYYEEEGGNFVFRMAMISERIDFLIHNPQYAITGVGCVHEQSSHNTYTMNVGTMLSDELSVMNTIGNLGSSDTIWVTIIMRFGLIGVILVLSYYLQVIFKTFGKIACSGNIIFTVYACMAIPALITTFDWNAFDRVHGQLALCATAAFIYIYINNSNFAHQNENVLSVLTPYIVKFRRWFNRH